MRPAWASGASDLVSQLSVICPPPGGTQPHAGSRRCRACRAGTGGRPLIRASCPSRRAISASLACTTCARRSSRSATARCRASARSFQARTSAAWRTAQPAIQRSKRLSSSAPVRRPSSTSSASSFLDADDEGVAQEGGVELLPEGDVGHVADADDVEQLPGWRSTTRTAPPGPALPGQVRPQLHRVLVLHQGPRAVDDAHARALQAVGELGVLQVGGARRRTTPRFEVGPAEGAVGGRRR